MINNISIPEKLLLEILEMERPSRILKWIYVPGHAGLEGNDTAHRQVVEGMCLITLWALPCTAFSRMTDDTQTAYEQSPCLAATPPPENIYAVQETTVIGVEDSTDSSPNDRPGAIWLSLGLVEMGEPEEGASQEHEATTTGLLHCGTSSTDDSKPYGWAEGTDYSTDVGDTNKKKTMASKNNKKRPPPLTGERGVAQSGPSFPLPRFT